MLAFRIIVGITLILLILVVGSFLWSLVQPGAGRLDAVATHRIQQVCSFQVECKLRITDLFEGDWDTFYEFGVQVPQSEMDRLLGRQRVSARAGQRLLVLSKDGKVQTAQYANEGTGKPLEGEIEFGEERHRDERTVRYGRNTWLRVNRFPIDAADAHAGTYFVLNETAP